MNENFLLTTSTSKELFHQCAKNLPVIDYHNHLSIDDLTSNRNFEDLAQLWVVSDPYKHRAMRICGVEEYYISGEASNYEKYNHWMQTLPKLIGNPLYDWSILEMKRIFDIELDPETIDAKWLWDETIKKLEQSEFTALKLLTSFNVEYIAPCASFVEDITGFMKFGYIAPSLRGDDIVDVKNTTLNRLEKFTGNRIDTLESYFNVITGRLEEFHKAGCKFSDHALDDGFVYISDDGKNEARFQRIRRGEILDLEEKEKLSSVILKFLASVYAKMGWTMQLHIGAQRFTSSRLRIIAGPAGGFAGIGSGVNVKSLTQMLDEFDQSEDGLPRTILFTLNPADNAVLSVLSGSYSQDGIVGKVQQGPAWWWCDHLYGMRETFENQSTFGVMSTFIGMTTDSRSILSFVRHEYFRRAFCGWIGEKADKGEITASKEALKQLVEKVCYKNVKKIINEESRREEKR